MQLDHLAARIRPRTAWEGVDLGFALARHWFPALWGLWCLSALPVGLLAALWFPGQPDVWMLLVWWLKPFYEAPLLFWLSRALFGATPNLRGLWQERSKALPLRLVPLLSWRRLHPSRSFYLPLILLEGLGGSERRRRWRLINNSSTGAWLTVICFHLESILWVSALLLAVYVLPKELPRLDPGAALFDVESVAYWVSAVLYWLAMSVMAPFYVAAGFGLYLTRRTELEAWDLELVFRRAGLQEDNRRVRAPSTTAPVVLLVLGLWTAPTLEAAVQDLDPQGARAQIAEVLAGKDFGVKREIQTWVYVGSLPHGEGELKLPRWVRQILNLSMAGADLMALLVKWVLVLAAAFICVLILRRILVDLRLCKSAPKAASRPKEILRKISLASDEDLPPDVEKQVRILIESGDLRAAMALLYRASLARLQQRRGLSIPPGATELECLTLMSGRGPAQETTFLRQLTRAWQRTAYGHYRPAKEEIAPLLRDWRQLEGGHGDV